MLYSTGPVWKKGDKWEYRCFYLQNKSCFFTWKINNRVRFNKTSVSNQLFCFVGYGFALLRISFCINAIIEFQTVGFAIPRWSSSHVLRTCTNITRRIVAPKWLYHPCRSILNLWIITFPASLISPLDWSLKGVNKIAYSTTFIKCNAEHEFKLCKSDSSPYVNVIYYMLYRCITMIESVQTTIWNLILLLSKGRPDYLTRYN